MGEGIFFLVLGVLWIIFRKFIAHRMLQVVAIWGINKDPQPEQKQGLATVAVLFGSLLAGMGAILILLSFYK